MAVQLILKNSAVQDKEATAAQLAVGEIALNYYESGPFLQCKDTAGNVWRLGGVVIASTAPATPSKGTWWLDSDDNSLRFYNGTSWIEVQTGEITVGDITEGTARQLLQTNSAGTAAEWTSNIDVPGTLDVTGVATFDNNVVITGNLTVNGTTTTIDTQTLLVEDKNIEMGVVATPTDSTADGGGITLKGTTDKTINWVNATGAWTSSEHLNLASGKSYRINGTEVLSATALGSAVQISSANIPSGTIVNDDVNASAAIAGTKISPDFGSQNVTTTGTSTAASFIPSSSTAPTNGVYLPAANTVAISTNGTGRLFIDSSGRLGLGTSSPNYKTQIAGTSGTVGLGLTGTYASGDIGYYFAPSAVTGSVVAFQSAANATTGVSALFANGNTADGTAHARVEAQVGGASAGDPKFVMTVSGATNWSAGIDNSDSDKFKISSSDSPGSSDRLTIDTSGNVGVGTTSPSYSLDVKQSSTGNSNTIAAKGGTNGGGYFWETNAGTTYGAIGYGDLISANSGSSNTAITSWGSQDLLLGTNRTERLRITSSGLVGIGVSSPSGRLHVIADANTTGAGLQTWGYDVNQPNYQLRLRTDVSAGVVKYNFNLLNQGTEYDNNLVLDRGKVGIGTSSPSARLDIATDSGDHIRLIGRGATDYSDIVFYNAANTTRLGYIDFANTQARINVEANVPFRLYTNAQERLTVTAAGNVGIGTTDAGSYSSAANNLVIAESGGNAGLTIRTDSANAGAIFFADGTASGAENGAGQISYDHSADAMRFTTAASERARIDSSGRLLVGTSSARTNAPGGTEGILLEGTSSTNSQNRFTQHVFGSSSTDGPYLGLAKTRSTSIGGNTVVQSGDELGGIYFQGADGSDFKQGASIISYVDGTPGANDMPGRLVFSTTADGASSPTERMRISQNGYISHYSTGQGINITTSQGAGTSYELYIGQHSSSAVGSGTTSYKVWSNGNVQNTNNSYGALSDIKLKENIVDAGSQWDDLKSLQVRKYNFKEETGQQTHTQIGLVAQEVELVSPGLVTESPDRDAEGNDLGTVTKSVNYSVLYMKAVKALQEAMERIEQLEAKVAALESA